MNQQRHGISSTGDELQQQQQHHAAFQSANYYQHHHHQYHQHHHHQQLEASHQHNQLQDNLFASRQLQQVLSATGGECSSPPCSSVSSLSPLLNERADGREESTASASNSAKKNKVKKAR